MALKDLTGALRVGVVYMTVRGMAVEGRSGRAVQVVQVIRLHRPQCKAGRRNGSDIKMEERLNIQSDAAAYHSTVVQPRTRRVPRSLIPIREAVEGLSR